MKQFKAMLKTIPGGSLLNPGEYIAKIKSVAETLSKPSSFWADRTPQVEVQFETEDEQTITQWFNLCGYENQADQPNGVAGKGHEFRSSENGAEQYLVESKSGIRIQSDAKTALAEKIFCEMANDAGINAGDSFSLSDLVGKSIGVKVRAKGQSVEVHYTMPTKRVKAAVEA